MFFDICIIGGGAAGMMSAITAKEAAPEFRVAVFEGLDRVGKKIALTGNGRCNITNKNIKADNYYGKNPRFAMPFLSKFSTEDTCRFFERIGVPIIFEGDKGYPRSLQAGSVVDALRFRMDELGIETFLNSKITSIRKNDNEIEIKTADSAIKCRAVIVTTGLLSGGVKLGCDGEMLKILGARLSSKTPSPAIVQLKTDTDFVRQLKGIKTLAEVKLLRGGKTIKTDFGETLFCDYGLSGPPILQLSGHAAEGDIISLDLAPDMSFGELSSCLEERREMLPMRKNDEFLSGLFNKRLGQVILKRAELSLSSYVKDIDDKQLKAICKLCKDFSLTVRGNTGFTNSQVSMGGFYTDQFDGKTLMATRLAGVFAAGEILDITGDCGGFNLQWAWSSGYAAAMGAVEYLR